MTEVKVADNTVPVSSDIKQVLTFNLPKNLWVCPDLRPQHILCGDDFRMASMNNMTQLWSKQTFWCAQGSRANSADMLLNQACDQG